MDLYILENELISRIIMGLLGRNYDPTVPMDKRQRGGEVYCREEGKASMKCLSDNNYDKSKCEKFFEQYRQCKTELMAIVKERRRRGLAPYDVPVKGVDPYS